MVLVSTLYDSWRLLDVAPSCRKRLCFGVWFQLSGSFTRNQMIGQLRQVVAERLRLLSNIRATTATLYFLQQQLHDKPDVHKFIAIEPAEPCFRMTHQSYASRGIIGAVLERWPSGIGI